MNTIYWLSVLTMCYGYFMFFGSIFSIWFTIKTGSMQEKMILEYAIKNGSIVNWIRWKELGVAAVATVIFCTI